MDWDRPHIVHVSGETETPSDPIDIAHFRRKIEPWLSAIFQTEHLSLLVGNGFTSAIAFESNAKPVTMDKVTFGCPHEDELNAFANTCAEAMGRDDANVEDQFSAAMALLPGLKITKDKALADWESAIDRELISLVRKVLSTEREIRGGLDYERSKGGAPARDVVVSFLMSFASRVASRERLHIFTTNYDRLVEFGCDLAGLRLLDRFVGALEPEFRSSRVGIDLHYTPPGIRSEPRHLEGVVHFTKLHGSLDWTYDKRRLSRVPLPFGADDKHPGVSVKPRETVVIYPNAAKDVETAAYPYADLFRDFSGAICQPNSALVTYGYGYGDDHVNRIIADMLTIPSTHLVVLGWGDAPHQRVARFVRDAGHPHQMTLLLGKHFGDVRRLVENYLPKPAIDPLTLRMTELLERRGWRAGEPLAKGPPS
jgi:hypothetical protein